MFWLFITVFLTVTTITAINVVMEKELKKSIKGIVKRGDHYNFKYAVWAMLVEFVGILLLSIPVIGLLVLSEDTYDYILYTVLLFFLIIIILYRVLSWGSEEILVRGDLLIYNRGIFKGKSSEVDLREVERVEVRLLVFVLHMRDIGEVKIPACFTDLRVLYSILMKESIEEGI